MRFGLAASSTAALATALLVPAPVDAQSQPRTKIDVSQLGPQVGEQVPDFRLGDQNGNTWTRESIMGANGAMLVFVRSADW